MNPILKYTNTMDYLAFLVANVGKIAEMVPDITNNRLEIKGDKLILIPSKGKPVTIPVGATIIFRKYGIEVTIEEALINKNCAVSLSITYMNGKKTVGISGRDIKDTYNLPTFFNKTKRGLEKAFKVLTTQFNEDTSMYGAMGVLGQEGVRTHSYCAMD